MNGEVGRSIVAYNLLTWSCKFASKKIIKLTRLNSFLDLDYSAPSMRKVARYAVNLTLRFWHQKQSQHSTK